ncbi:hypothetical protein JVT61DRAFT_4222 [Boletus reticuloceps]|uniref:Uncharacterized protein n=1 Tax=Boletus reticuloceps TaxID=495285 RepID=A0A8I2YNP7_9AGAM|nr:hypothetical protein JVT61DRAFT_4222 [Boletus reticuloceps]
MSLLSRWLLVLFAVLYFLWLSTHKASTHGPAIHVPFVEDHSLTVILPVIQSTVASLDHLLAPFLVTTTIIMEVAIVCPNSLVPDVHRKLRIILSNATRGHPRVSLYPWSGVTHHHQASVEAIARIKTQWVLLLDEHGFKQVAECDRAYLVHPRAVHLPVGPRGFTGSALNWSQLSSSDRIQPAAFLVPPFVVPSNLLARPLLTTPPSLFWPALGTYVAKSTLGLFGGIVIGADILNKVDCNPTTTNGSDDDPDSRTLVDPSSLPISDGFFVLAFPNKEDLKNFIPATCKLHHKGYTVLAYLYDTIDEAEFSGTVNDRNCTVPYFRRSKETAGLSDWLNSLGFIPDIVIGLDHQDLVSSTFSLILELPPFLNTTLIRLPRRELPYTEWIGTLTLDELRHWNVPEITLSVITNNRPHSLRRLLESIQRTLFYGDKVNIRVNMDQTADPETLHIVYDLEWPHGDIFLHHRVIHGGLLPAVVESWYPHCDDSYGLLLEDDIELSPLAYAWIKMTLLRYKFYTERLAHLLQSSSGSASTSRKSSSSVPPAANPSTRVRSSAPLRSQTPLPPTSPKSHAAGAPSTSPLPGANSTTISPSASPNPPFPVDSSIVPGVRSNKWTKSWKKYFIELVYLRGYVMLYPNYDDFVSLSTNHLEVGSHVRGEPGEVYERKKRLFSLPLMRLVGALARGDGDVGHGPGLLDLPGAALPEWDRLPVLDLLGEVSSMEGIQARGDQRRAELDVCVGVESLPASVRDLLCHIPL